MKIAQVCPYDFSRPGGVKSHILSLSKYLVKLGHEVKILAPNINADNVGESNVYFFGKNRSLSIGGTKIDLNVALREEKKALVAFLKDETFDVIHYHTIWNPFLPLQVRRYSKARQIATFHDTPKSEFIGKWIMPTMARWIFPFLDEVISVSKTQSKFISRFSKRKIHIIPNGIDLEEVRKFQVEKEVDESFQLLFLGRLEPRKGIFHALEAFRTLKMVFPKCKMVIAGDGDQRDEVEKFITDYKLDDVVLKGFVSEEEKYRLLKNSDVYLGTALYGESFGIVLLEAMAIGTPIAGFANEGYKNVLTSTMQESFVEPGNTKALLPKIEAFLLKAKREQMIQEGFEEIKKYDWKIISKQIERLY